MTLSVYAPAIAFGNGVVTAFDFPFPASDETRLSVQIEDVVTGEILTPTLSNYTVIIDHPAGGTVTFNSIIPTINQKVVISSAEPYLQGTDFLNQGGFFPEAIEDAMDSLDKQIQQVKERTDRAIRGPAGTAFADLEGAAIRAGKFLAFDSAGNPSLATEVSAGTLTTLGPFTDNAILRWDGTTGGSIQGSLATVDDIGRLVVSVVYDALVADQAPTTVDFNTTSVPGYTGHMRTLRLDGIVGSADVTGNALTQFVNACDRNIAGPGGILLCDVSLRDNTQSRSSVGAPGGSTGMEIGVHGSGQDDAEARTIIRANPKGLFPEIIAGVASPDDFYVKSAIKTGNHHWPSYDQPYTPASLNIRSWSLIGFHVDADAEDGGVVVGFEADDIYDTALVIRDPRMKGIFIDIGAHPGGYKDCVLYPSKKADYGIQIIGEPVVAHIDIFASGPQGTVRIGRNTNTSTGIGQLQFTALNAASAVTAFAGVRGEVTDFVAGSEDSRIVTSAFAAGAIVDTLRLGGVSADFQVDIFRNGTKVVGTQGAAVANATDATTVIARLNDLLARVRAHGLIAP